MRAHPGTPTVWLVSGEVRTERPRYHRRHPNSLLLRPFGPGSLPVPVRGPRGTVPPSETHKSHDLQPVGTETRRPAGEYRAGVLTTAEVSFRCGRNPPWF